MNAQNIKNSYMFLSVCLCLLFNAPVFGKEEYHWPPKDGEPIITLLGQLWRKWKLLEFPHVFRFMNHLQLHIT